jgi:hypothetical protein
MTMARAHLVDASLTGSSIEEHRAGDPSSLLYHFSSTCDVSPPVIVSVGAATMVVAVTSALHVTIFRDGAAKRRWDLRGGKRRGLAMSLVCCSRRHVQSRLHASDLAFDCAGLDRFSRGRITSGSGSDPAGCHVAVLVLIYARGALNLRRVVSCWSWHDRSDYSGWRGSTHSGGARGGRRGEIGQGWIGRGARRDNRQEAHRSPGRRFGRAVFLRFSRTVAFRDVSYRMERRAMSAGEPRCEAWRS